MTTQDYLQILKQESPLDIFSQKRLEKKVYALAQIAKGGRPGMIFHLTPFLSHRSATLRQAAFEAIHTLFLQIKSKNGYTTLKYCAIRLQTLNAYDKHFNLHQCVVLNAIASFNANGFVREKAVRHLGAVRDPLAIPYLLYRQSDWVAEVRTAAKKALGNYLVPDFVHAFVYQLPVLEEMRQVKRINLSSTYNEIIQYLVKTHRSAVLAQFKAFPEKIRRLLGQHLSGSLQKDVGELSLFLTDKSFLVRQLALDHLEQFNEQDIYRLLKDKSAVVRFKTLQQLQLRPDFKVNYLEFVADPSASVRYFSRFHLKSDVEDFGAIYHQNLRVEQQIVGSILGLNELETEINEALIMPFLASKKTVIQRAAFIVLSKKMPEIAYTFALKHITHSSAKMRKALLDFLRTRATDEVMECVEQHFAEGDFPIKKSILQFFNQLGGWKALPALILGTIDENEDIRNRSKQYLNNWMVKKTRLFLQPSPQTLQRTQKIYHLAKAKHDQHQYFPEDPLKGLARLIFPESD
jgi:hypothetical protein